MNDQTYHPICETCDNDGDVTLATDVVDAPWGRVHLCQKHYDQAGEQAHERMLEDYYGGSGCQTDAERMSAAYAVDRGQK
jgi:hypothetical protein